MKLTTIRRAFLAAGRISLAALALSLAASAEARDIFVNNQAGDDLASGHEPTTTEASRGPVRSIRKAIDLAFPADRIVVANTGEPYRESLVISGPKRTGYFGAPVIIDGGDAVLDGATRIAAGDWEAVGGDVFRYLPKPSTYVPLYLKGRPLEEIRPEKTDPPATEPAALEPLQWTRFDRHIYFRIEAGKNLADYELAIPGADVGITIYKARHVVVANLVVQNFRLDGINVADGRDVLLVNVVARGNGRSGIAVTGPAQATVEGCRLGANGAAQLWLDGWTTTEVVDSTLFASTFAPAVRRGPHAKVEIDDATNKSIDAPPAAESNAVEPQPQPPVEASSDATEASATATDL